MQTSTSINPSVYRRAASLVAERASTYACCAIAVTADETILGPHANFFNQYFKPENVSAHTFWFNVYDASGNHLPELSREHRIFALLFMELIAKDLSIAP